MADLRPGRCSRRTGSAVNGTGKSVAAIHHLIKDAGALEVAGAFAVVLEGIRRR